MFTPDQWGEIRTLGLCSIFASITGGLSYLVKVQEGKAFSWFEFVLHLGVSACAGVIAYQVLHYFDTPIDLAGALCGIAGWMGTRVMRIFEVIFLRRFGLTPQMIEEKDSKKNE